MKRREIRYGAETGENCPVCEGPIQERAMVIPNAQEPPILRPIEPGCRECDEGVVIAAR